MPAETRNITIEQGATFTWQFGVREDDGNGNPSAVPIPLTGSTLRMQIRKAQGEQVLLEATSGDGLSHDGAGGNVTVVLPPSKTNLLTSKSCRYDMEADFGGDDVTRLVEGAVTVKPNMTQDPGEPIVGR